MQRGEWVQFILNRIYLRFKHFFYLRELRRHFNVYFRISYTLLQSLSDDLNICTVIIVYSLCHLIHFHSAALYCELSLMYLDLGLAKLRTLNQENKYFKKTFWYQVFFPPSPLSSLLLFSSSF